MRIRELVRVASFPSRRCFEEATAETEAVLTALQNQQRIAWVPGIWRYEILNGLGKRPQRSNLRCLGGRLLRSRKIDQIRRHRIREVAVEFSLGPIYAMKRVPEIDYFCRVNSSEWFHRVEEAIRDQNNTGTRSFARHASIPPTVAYGSPFFRARVSDMHSRLRRRYWLGIRALRHQLHAGTAVVYRPDTLPTVLGCG